MLELLYCFLLIYTSNDVISLIFILVAWEQTGFCDDLTYLLHKGNYKWKEAIGDALAEEWEQRGNTGQDIFVSIQEVNYQITWSTQRSPLLNIFNRW